MSNLRDPLLFVHASNSKVKNEKIILNSDQLRHNEITRYRNDIKKQKKQKYLYFC